VLDSYVDQFGESASLVPPVSAWGGDAPWALQWSDAAFLLIFGGIPWQVYFQRVLASRDPKSAVRLSIAAGFGCFLVAIPAIMIGLVGATFDWSQLPDGGPSHPALVLPYVLRYLTPPIIALLGLTAVAAAVMSSVDSSILSASTLFAWNVYRPLLQKNRGDDAKTRQVARTAVVVFGLCATLLALNVKSVYTLWFLCADLVYVILFPQLLMALYCRQTNQAGVLSGIAIGLFLRLGGGEPALGISSFITYPIQDDGQGTLFPFRTFAMLVSLVTIWAVSKMTWRWIPPKQTDPDFFREQPLNGESR
jgi:high affinity choline transporter 7